MARARYKKRADGRYYTSIQHGFKDDGKPNRINLYGKTSKELEEKVSELKYNIKNGLYKEPNDILLQDYADKWFKTYKASKGVNTKNMYKFVINSHITPAIGFIKVEDIKKSDIQLMINERMAKRRTCEQIILTLKQILDMAVEDEIVDRNICTRIELPAKKPSEKRALTKKEIKAIKIAKFTEREKSFINLLYYFGLRREEVIALMKNDFDFDKKKLNISRAIAFDENDPVVKDTKTESGNRTLDIPDVIIGDLRAFIESLDTLYLFTKQDGGILTKSAYNVLFNKIRAKINICAGGTSKINAIEGLTAYTFRHNFCTMLYYSEISIKKAAELMGHKDIKMIMEVYAHLDEEKEKTSKKINKIFDSKNVI